MHVNTNCKARVNASRELTNGTRLLLPDPLRCARYAQTEGAECDDAVMREEFTEDYRNNHRNDDARKEWGQCGYMILSAIIQMPSLDLPEVAVTLRHPALYYYGATMQHLANYVQETAVGHPFSRSGQTLAFAWHMWRCYAEIRGWEPIALIDDTCTTFERKHVPGLFVDDDHKAAAMRVVEVLARDGHRDAPELYGAAVIELVSAWQLTEAEAKTGARWAVDAHTKGVMVNYG